MDSKEKKMYKLIWQITLESCMSPASFFSLKASIIAPERSNYYCTSEIIDFPGWMTVTLSNTNKHNQEENKIYQIFATIKQEQIIKCTKVLSKVSMKDTKQHYTEAKLVNLLEENGIGRPSTFSSLVDKIQERIYVKNQDVIGNTIECKDYELVEGDIFEMETQREFGNEKNKLVIQPLGILVLEFLEKHFSELFFNVCVCAFVVQAKYCMCYKYHITLFVFLERNH